MPLHGYASQMAGDPGAGDELDQALHCEATERQRVARAAEIAERHEAQAQTCPVGMREFHTRMAATHRRAERRHLAAARMHAAYAERVRRWAELSGRAPEFPGFLASVAESVGARGVTVTFFGANEAQTLAAASDPAAKAAQDLEFMLGEGPTRETARSAEPLAVSGSALCERWPLFGPAVMRLGVRLVAALPMEPTGSPFGSLGTLTLLDPRPEATEDLELLHAAAGALTPLAVPPGFTAGAAADTGWPAVIAQADLRPVVHQATGFLSAQRECAPADALALIRAHAFTHDRTVEAVAADIVDRTLRLG